MFYVLIGCDILMVLTFLLKFNTLPPQIPLFFSRPWGEDQLVDSWFIIILPILQNVLFFVNQAIYQKYFMGNEFVYKIIKYLTIFIIVSFTLIFIKILFLVS